MANRSSSVLGIDPLLDSEQLAALLGVTRKALYNSRHAGQLPPPIKIGSRLRWRQSDILAWLDESRENSGVNQ